MVLGGLVCLQLVPVFERVAAVETAVRMDRRVRLAVTRQHRSVDARILAARASERFALQVSTVGVICQVMLGACFERAPLRLAVVFRRSTCVRVLVVVKFPLNIIQTAVLPIYLSKQSLSK